MVCSDQTPSLLRANSRFTPRKLPVCTAQTPGFCSAACKFCPANGCLIFDSFQYDLAVFWVVFWVVPVPSQIICFFGSFWASAAEWVLGCDATAPWGTAEPIRGVRGADARYARTQCVAAPEPLRGMAVVERAVFDCRAGCA